FEPGDRLLHVVRGPDRCRCQRKRHRHADGESGNQLSRERFAHARELHHLVPKRRETPPATALPKKTWAVANCLSNMGHTGVAAGPIFPPLARQDGAVTIVHSGGTSARNKQRRMKNRAPARGLNWYD